MGPLKIPAAVRLLTFLFLFIWALPLAAETVSGRVSWIYDGDTIKVEKVGKVRLLGIDSPEQEGSSRDNYYWRHYRIAPERLRTAARNALKYNIRKAKGQAVTLEFDRERRDKFGRTLAYVYLPDGRLLNRLLLEQGLATVYRRFDFQLKKDFLDAEQSARAAGIGLWAE